MKQTILSTLTILTLLITSCGGAKNMQKESIDHSKLTGYKWQLIELADKTVDGKINNKTPYLSFIASESRYSATGGCNMMNGGYSFTKKANGIHFSQGISTMMACDDMESDRALAAAFAGTNNYQIVDGVLSLNKGNKTLAKFKAIETAAELAGTWELDYIDAGGKTIQELFPNSKPTLKYDATAKTISGKGGCNNYQGPAEINGSSAKFGPVVATQMACEGNGESIYFETLKKINSIDVNGETLTMIVGDIATMRFKKVN